MASSSESNDGTVSDSSISVNEGPTLKKFEYIEINTESEDKKCTFCKRSTIDELNLGTMYMRDGVISHYFCLLFCSNLSQRGKDDEGILGFRTEDIRKEVARIHSTQNKNFYKCHFCNETGASIGCCVARCRYIFHFPCGLTNKVNYRFDKRFRSFCSTHTSLPMDRNIRQEYRHCSICYCDLTTANKENIMFGTCCRYALFHKECIQKYALSSGYFFKCPACASKQVFKYDMQMQGVFIPDRDASWELEKNAFSELRVRYSKCDAIPCLCPSGRERRDREKGSIWYLLRCSHCAGSGTHIGCSTQCVSAKTKWICKSCLEVDAKLKESRAKKKRMTGVATVSTNCDEDDEIESTISSSSYSSSTLFSVIRKPSVASIAARDRISLPLLVNQDNQEMAIPTISSSSSSGSLLSVSGNRSNISNASSTFPLSSLFSVVRKPPERVASIAARDRKSLPSSVNQDNQEMAAPIISSSSSTSGSLLSISGNRSNISNASSSSLSSLFSEVQKRAAPIADRDSISLPSLVNQDNQEMEKAGNNHIDGPIVICIDSSSESDNDISIEKSVGSIQVSSGYVSNSSTNSDSLFIPISRRNVKQKQIKITNYIRRSPQRQTASSSSSSLNRQSPATSPSSSFNSQTNFSSKERVRELHLIASRLSRRRPSRLMRKNIMVIDLD